MQVAACRPAQLLSKRTDSAGLSGSNEVRRLRARLINAMIGASCFGWMVTTPLIFGRLLLMLSAGTIEVASVPAYADRGMRVHASMLQNGGMMHEHDRGRLRCLHTGMRTRLLASRASVRT